jgi:hypothetical protein
MKRTIVVVITASSMRLLGTDDKNWGRTACLLCSIAARWAVPNFTFLIVLLLIVTE